MRRSALTLALLVAACSSHQEPTPNPGGNLPDGFVAPDGGPPITGGGHDLGASDLAVPDLGGSDLGVADLGAARDFAFARDLGSSVPLWTVDTLDVTDLTSVEGAGPDAVYLVGTPGAIVSGTAGAWAIFHNTVEGDMTTVAVATSNEIFASGAMPGPDGAAVIFRSQDLGATWRDVASVPNNWIRGLSGSSSSDLWAATSGTAGGSIVHFTNNLQAQTPIVWTESFVTPIGVLATPTDVVWIGTNSVLYRSTDFRTIASRTPLPFANPTAMRGDSMRLVVGSATGDVGVTTDRGATWITATAGGGVIRAVFMLPLGEVWAVGDAGAFQSTDGGRTFRQLPLPVPPPYKGVWESAPHDVYIVGGNHVIHGG